MQTVPVDNPVDRGRLVIFVDCTSSTMDVDLCRRKQLSVMFRLYSVVVPGFLG